MARKSSSTAVQEELYPLPQGSREEYDAPGYGAARHDASTREPFDDSRLVDLEAEQESAFLRGQKRVSVRRGSLPKKTAIGLKWTVLALVVAALLCAAGATLYSYGKHSWRFRIDSSDQIEVLGTQHVSHAQIMEVMGGDIGRNIFFVPLAQRQQQLEQIPWVESASVMRFVPNRLRIEIHERTPVAFARVGSHISLIDAGGNLMELAPGPKHKYSFPVITGMNSNEPLSTRAARMKNYNALLQQLDSSGARYSQDISEVDLSDPEDVKVVTADANGDVLVHLGSSSFLQRYRVYVTHVQAWRQQFEKLDSVDLRYDGQIIVNPDLEGISRQPALTQAAAKAALAAGVKNAAIVNYEKYVSHPATPVLASKPAPSKTATRSTAKPVSKSGVGIKVASKSAAHPVSKPKTKIRTKTAAKPAIARDSAATHPAPAANNAADKKAPAKTPLVAASATHAPAAPATKPTPLPVINAGQKTVVSTSTQTPAPTSAKSSQTTGSKPAHPASSPSAAVAGSTKKPSAAIPKETSQN